MNNKKELNYMQSVIVISILIYLFFIPQIVFSQDGTIVTEIVSSDAIANNLLGDDPIRDISIYLPAAYDQYPDSLFPVIYLLHGYTNTDASFLNNYGLKEQFDDFFRGPNVQPMIIVIPNAHNTYRGSWYTNSYLTGNWEDFITQELVEFIDEYYRTIESASGRGIAGHSMGGYGALKLAMKYPDIYGAVYGLSSAWIVFEDVLLGTMKSSLVQASNATNFNNLYWKQQVMIAGAAAFTPDTLSSPFQCRFPVTTTGDVVDSTWQKWLIHDPYSMTDTYKANLLELIAIKFDCGTQDNELFNSQKIFSQKLTEESIPHTYVEFVGNHTEKLADRIRNHMLPFFSDNLLTVTTHIKSTQQYIPNMFLLSQNYPNPFNPSTTFKYEIPKESYITLKVYDILGREVATLVNREQQAGYYEVDWNAASNSSGVYFYKIQAGDFVETKKMILLR